MWDTATTVADSGPHPKLRWGRLDAAHGVVDFEAAKKRAVSQRAFAREADIPRTSLQGWLERKARLNAVPALIAFYESPDGQAHLHQIHSAAHFTFGQQGPDGTRLIALFLKRAGLGPFVGTSYGAQHTAATAMEKNIELYCAMGHEVLAKMPPKSITLAQDETFFPEICLVAMDPVSDFIFLEEFADKRDAATWTPALSARLAGLPITVIQAVGDAAKALQKHTREGLGAHYSPDLFHGLHDIYKAIGPTLQARTRQAESAYEDAKAAATAQLADRDEYLAAITDRGPGRPPDFEVKIQATTAAETEALERLKSLAAVKERLKLTVGAISEAYHPVNLASGKVQAVADVEQAIEQSFDVLGEIADDLDVAERGQHLLAKARRLVPPMIETLGFFSESAIALLTKANLAADLILFLVNCLIPLAYLKMAESKAKGTRRQLIRTTIEGLTATAYAASSPLVMAAEEARVRLLGLAQECAELFQRSSSCVEGRNGALSLHHHAGRSLAPQRLHVLQIIHNFGIERPDGTTAAERLSGIKPPDLFTWLLERQPLPPRPAASRTTLRPKAVA